MEIVLVEVFFRFRSLDFDFFDAPASLGAAFFLILSTMSPAVIKKTAAIMAKMSIRAQTGEPAVDAGIRRFVKNNVDLDKIIQYLALVKQMDIGPDTLLIFDEAQKCMPILTALKYFYERHREIPIIATGSMVRIKINASESGRRSLDGEIDPENQDGSNSYMFPLGKVDEYTLHPMTFDEYLKASKPRLYGFVKNSCENRTAFSSEEHSPVLQHFYDYLIVGGMPEAVAVFLRTQSYGKARQCLRTIYDNYLNDMVLYQISNQTIIRTKGRSRTSIFNSVRRTKTPSSPLWQKGRNSGIMKPRLIGFRSPALSWNRTKQRNGSFCLYPRRRGLCSGFIFQTPAFSPCKAT